MIRLAPSFIDKMIHKPETGMGYQSVMVDFKGKMRQGVVYNAELLPWDVKPKTDLAEKKFQLLLEMTDSVGPKAIRRIKVLPPAESS